MNENENGGAAPNTGANKFVFTEEQIKEIKNKYGNLSYSSVQKLLTYLSEEIQKDIDGLL